MRLSATIIGVTLLSLGNDAFNVFVGVVSFIRFGNGCVGLKSVLGGAFFVSSDVGVISIKISSHRIAVDKFEKYVTIFLNIKSTRTQLKEKEKGRLSEKEAEVEKAMRRKADKEEVMTVGGDERRVRYKQE
ncbi:hypothetical protein V6N13_028386 [Hibiscus sabdariffa]